jgi:predicted outer membrane protein
MATKLGNISTGRRAALGVLTATALALAGGASGAASPKGTQKGLPASFTAYGNSYSISSFTIEAGKNGNQTKRTKHQTLFAFAPGTMIPVI